MKDLRLTSAFKRDLERITKRNCDRDLLDAVVDFLRQWGTHADLFGK